MSTGDPYKVLRVFSVIFLLWWTVGCQEKETPLPEHLGGQIYQGKARFDIKCHGCHGWLGEGRAQAPALTKAGRTIPYFDFYSAVIYGRGGGMPAYQRMLGENEIRLMMDWLEQVSVLRVME